MCLGIKSDRGLRCLARCLPPQCLLSGTVAVKYASRQWTFQHEGVNIDTLITFRFGIRHDSGEEDFLARTDQDAVIRTARE
jgi:hypothetical protein